MARIGILTGLAREEACLAPLRRDPQAPLVRCSATRTQQARAFAEELAKPDVVGLVSFGLAGGLDAALPAGTLVLPAEVCNRSGQRWAVDPAWRASLAGLVAATPIELLVGVDKAVAGTAAKAALREETGAAACDMESHHVARLATAAGRPFVAVRAIVDTADQALPPWTLALTRETGGLAWERAIVGTLTHPGDWRALSRLGKASRSALGELRRLVAAAGPVLGFPGL